MSPIRIIPTLSVVLAFLPPAACQPAEQESTTPRSASGDSVEVRVREAVSAFTEAMNGEEPDSILSFYAGTEAFVYVGCTDPIFGWEAFSARVGAYYASRPDLVFEREILEVQVASPTMAVVTLRGSSSEADHLFWTQVLRRNEYGRWLIVHEHESWPGCPDPPALHPTGNPPGPGRG
jgi:ketosteroid isomerase-like protein